MTGAILTLFDMLAANRTARRRARNLRAARRATAAPKLPRAYRPGWLAIGASAFAIAGAAVLALHAGSMASAARPGGAVSALAAVLPGAVLEVPGAPSIRLAQAGGAVVLIASGVRPGPAVRVDLCSQLPDPARPRLAPLRVGWTADDVAGLVRRNEAAGRPALLRNVVLAPAGARMPRVEIGGVASPGFDAPLSLRWDGAARWVGDAGSATVQGGKGEAAFARQGWLVWGPADALRVTRRPSSACPQAGELVLQAYRAAGTAQPGAMVYAFGPQGAPVSAWLAPGQYRLPSDAARRYEDQKLFDELLAQGLIRLNEAGLAELAPPDLMQWRAAGDPARVPVAPAWQAVVPDERTRKLLDRLYHRADGDFVREQVRVFNSERRLLAWRLPAAVQGVGMRLAIDGAAAQVAEGAPAVAARLFARLPDGWSAWQRAAAWPGSGRVAEIVLELPGPTPPLQMLVAGRVESVAGAVLAARENACTGRGCAAPDAVQRLVLVPQAREVRLRVAPLDTSALAAMDAPYRHLVAANGQLRWQALAQAGAPAAPALAQVALTDRDGKPLWGEGAPTSAAREAGLATLLGLRPDHAGSVAGMLARLPSPSGAPHAARLSIDTGMQRLANAVLDCVAMRRGQWTGSACAGGAAPPAGRQAGLVILDTETGDLLAAASSPGAPSSAAWSDMRDFDRANPAASVLRVPALQHDGGIHRSPGSTFKVVTALGLELAAQRDRRIDALLAGRPLADIDRSAREAGFAFQTGSPAYPANSPRAHITNFREQLVTRRAHDGQLGLAQALAYSINTWFAWTAEMSDATLFGKPDGGVPGMLALDTQALGALRPIAEMAHRIGFEQPLRLDGGLLPAGYAWSAWDVLQPPPAHMDPIHSRHEVRQMAIGLRMQATPLQMALAAGAVGQGRMIQPRLLLELDGRKAEAGQGAPLGVRLDRIRAGMKGVVDHGTAAGAFRAARFDRIRPALYGKTGTAPTGTVDASGRELATVWFTGWLEPGALPGQRHRLAFGVFASHSDATGGEHVAPAIGAILRTLQENSPTKQ